MTVSGIQAPAEAVPLDSTFFRKTTNPQLAFHVRRATPADAEEIASLGACVFAQTFGHSMTERDLNAYLEEAYPTHVIEGELSTPSKHCFIVACTSTEINGDAGTSPPLPAGSVIGFAQLTLGTSMPCLADFTSNKIELQRFYVYKAGHGTGIARAMMDEASRIAKEEFMCDLIWLGVWEFNDRAQNFYRKSGYRKVGAKDFCMGDCIQTDEVFVKDLKCSLRAAG